MSKNARSFVVLLRGITGANADKMITTSDKINNERNKTSMRMTVEVGISNACIKIEKFSFNTFKYLGAFFVYLSARRKGGNVRLKNVPEIFHCLR